MSWDWSTGRFIRNPTILTNSAKAYTVYVSSLLLQYIYISIRRSRWSRQSTGAFTEHLRHNGGTFPQSSIWHDTWHMTQLLNHFTDRVWNQSAPQRRFLYSHRREGCSCTRLCRNSWAIPRWRAPHMYDRPTNTSYLLCYISEARSGVVSKSRFS